MAVDESSTIVINQRQITWRTLILVRRTLKRAQVVIIIDYSRVNYSRE